jgi:hypothetical protein
MPFESTHRRHRRLALAVGLAALALSAPAAVADLRSAAPTSSLAGTTSAPAPTHAMTPSDVASAMYQERYYSSYADAAPLSSGAPGVDAADGIALVPFLLSVIGALVLGIASSQAVHRLASRRSARLA